MPKFIKISLKNQKLINNQYRQLEGAKRALDIAMNNSRLAQNAMEDLLNHVAGDGMWTEYSFDGSKVIVETNSEGSQENEPT